MICTRCGKLVVEDRFMDWTARWRCLKCGHIEDSASVQSFLEHQKHLTFLQKLCLKSAEPNSFDEQIYVGSESSVGPRPPAVHSTDTLHHNSKRNG